jgi:plasmid stability protein
MNLSIKNVPEEMVEQLRHRARENHRSLQGELMAVLEQTLTPKKSTIAEVRRKLAALSYSTEDEAVRMVREDRDGR